MKKHLPVAPLRSSESDSDGADHDREEPIVVPNKLIAMDDSFEKKGYLWFLTSQIPTDLSVQVQDITFNVHKCPLVSKCGYIGRIEFQPSISKPGYELNLENFPGNSETFETILKFCYGIPVDLNPSNIAPLRCAAEFLEMTEEFEDGNLISKTESFLTFVILSSWRDTIAVLKSCENLSPWAENLQIVRRCCDTIAWKACRDTSTPEDITNELWWIDDVTILRIDHFTRIITSIRAKGARPENVGKCIMQYAERWLPGIDMELEGLRGYGNGIKELHFSILSGKEEKKCFGHQRENRIVIENLISILPPQEEAVPCRFLLNMLKLAIMFSASPALISDLEKRVGMTLEEANASDLLIPNYKNEDQGRLANGSPEHSTTHNIDVVQRILDYYLMHKQQQQQRSGISNISKLLDNYLAEVARDPNLSITQFQVLAEALPEKARTCDDGLYRAIDIYLKTHPSLPEHDRKRLCKVMNCEKLSMDACIHAAQNDRLPLRTVIQVLFSEQVKLRAEMQKREPAADGDNSENELNSIQPSTKTEIKGLKTELNKMKAEMAELQRDYIELQQDYGKINRKKSLSSWTLRWKKFRKSGLFHRKTVEEETRDGQRESGQGNGHVNSRRRQSIS